MSTRMVDAKPGERIVLMNGTALLKLIGWIEAHRPPGEWEPGFLGQCLAALEGATEGEALDGIFTCGACGLEHHVRMSYDFTVGGWFCDSDDECNQRRMGEEATA